MRSQDLKLELSDQMAVLVLWCFQKEPESFYSSGSMGQHTKATWQSRILNPGIPTAGSVQGLRIGGEHFLGTICFGVWDTRHAFTGILCGKLLAMVFLGELRLGLSVEGNHYSFH